MNSLPEQYVFQVFYNIPQPGYENQCEALRTVSKTHYIHNVIMVDGNKDVAQSMIIIGTKR